jgi:arginine decarboxylase-like protein
MDIDQIFNGYSDTDRIRISDIFQILNKKIIYIIEK